MPLEINDDNLYGTQQEYKIESGKCNLIYIFIEQAHREDSVTRSTKFKTK